eukprot:scaffold18992_cov113-Isochrysis_galbana.AAC.8
MQSPTARPSPDLVQTGPRRPRHTSRRPRRAEAALSTRPPRPQARRTSEHLVPGGSRSGAGAWRRPRRSMSGKKSGNGGSLRPWATAPWAGPGAAPVAQARGCRVHETNSQAAASSCGVRGAMGRRCFNHVHCA